MVIVVLDDCSLKHGPALTTWVTVDASAVTTRALTIGIPSKYSQTNTMLATLLVRDELWPEMFKPSWPMDPTIADANASAPDPVASPRTASSSSSLKLTPQLEVVYDTSSSLTWTK